MHFLGANLSKEHAWLICDLDRDSDIELLTKGTAPYFILLDNLTARLGDYKLKYGAS